MSTRRFTTEFLFTANDAQHRMMFDLASIKLVSDAEFGGDQRPLNVYITVDVYIDGSKNRIASMIGARDEHHASIRESGCGLRPYCTAWQNEASDLEQVEPWAQKSVALLLENYAYTLFVHAVP